MFRVLAACALLCASCDREDPPFELSRVEPSVVPLGEESPAMVRGRHLYGSVKVNLDESEAPAVDRGWSVRVGGTELEAVQHVGPEAIEIVLPPTLPAGTHDLTATSPRGPSQTLAGAIEVTAAAADGGMGGSADAGGMLGPFGQPQLVEELSDPTTLIDDPTLTEDRLEIFFNRGSDDIWTAKRPSTAEPWGTPQAVDALNSSATESEPEVSADGLTIYLVSTRGGGVDIWRSTRPTRGDPWSTPELVPELNSSAFDEAAAPSPDRRSLVLYSTRDGNYDLYLAERDATTDPWPTPAPMDALNTGAYESDAHLGGQAQTVVFASESSGDMDLYVAERPARGEAFGDPVPLDELNGDAAERDPWISPDLRYIIFLSQRSGDWELYEASR